ncbi:Brp/Blh family beta-carotene 15,15'-dioxygenase [Flavobacterium sp. 25HG05S-40]|uniref:Brp/Blh family beta-carotene 15,15'-dioxygenase n=1 Tax=Flavobacterium sp. 25HG05S-40 TaxID=3458682 RepID=UPI004043F01D
MILKNSKISILLTFIGLWLTSYVNSDTQIFIGFLLIFLFGISHGANDLLIVRKITNNKSSSYKRIVYLYISVIVLAIILFTVIPSFGLFLFIVVSSYHFGEQHWKNKLFQQIRLQNVAFQTIYGLFIIMLLLHFHNKEVIKIIKGITAIEINAVLIFNVLKTVSLILFISLCYAIYKSKIHWPNLLEELLYLLVFGIVFKVGTLIWGFTIYFIIWHSLPSLQDQIKFLYRELSFKTFTKYCWSALPYWIISVIGIAVSYLLFKDYKIFDSLFFTFLAAVTFPHVFVIERMFSATQKKPDK